MFINRAIISYDKIEHISQLFIHANFLLRKLATDTIYEFRSYALLRTVVQFAILVFWNESETRNCEKWQKILTFLKLQFFQFFPYKNNILVILKAVKCAESSADTYDR